VIFRNPPSQEYLEAITQAALSVPTNAAAIMIANIILMGPNDLSSVVNALDRPALFVYSSLDWAVEATERRGAGEILLTSMDRDGTKNGFELGVTRAITDAVEIPVIASGGVGNLDHLVDGILLGGADAVLAASIFHFGEFTVPEAKAYMAERGIEVRL